MEIPASLGALVVAIVTYMIAAGAIYLMTRHPSRQPFNVPQLVADIDRSIAIGAVLIGSASLALYFNPEFIEQQHQALPFIYWVAGSGGVLAFVTQRVLRAMGKCPRDATMARRITE